MKYISIGTVMTEGTENILNVSHGGYTFCLTGPLADLWLNGRYGFSQTKGQPEDKVLKQLIRMGLAIATDGSSAEEYRVLTRCTLVPADHRHPFWGLSTLERTVLRWLREAGLVLSMAELTYLVDRKIALQPCLLGNDNTQALVETIYTKDTIFDNILENLMERSGAREKTVKAVLALLKKKRIVLL